MFGKSRKIDVYGWNFVVHGIDKLSIKIVAEQFFVEILEIKL
jgi:hypothetical protein